MPSYSSSALLLTLPRAEEMRVGHGKRGRGMWCLDKRLLILHRCTLWCVFAADLS